jgi:hypothetical protein
MTQFWYFHSGLVCDYFEGGWSLAFTALFIIVQLSWERDSLLVCSWAGVQHLGRSHSLNCCECRSLGQRQCVQGMCHLYWPYQLHVSSSQLLCVNCEQTLFSSSESSTMMCLSCSVYRLQGTARIFVLVWISLRNKMVMPCQFDSTPMSKAVIIKRVKNLVVCVSVEGFFVTLLMISP